MTKEILVIAITAISVTRDATGTTTATTTATESEDADASLLKSVASLVESVLGFSSELSTSFPYSVVLRDSTLLHEAVVLGEAIVEIRKLGMIRESVVVLCVLCDSVLSPDSVVFCVLLPSVLVLCVFPGSVVLTNSGT